VATAPKVLEIFRHAGACWGFPAALLTDNGCVYTTWHRGGPNVMQSELLALGIDYRHSRPYHPHTSGEVERFHQTLKRWPAKQRPTRTIAELQGQLDRFVAYYNEVRPHRARDADRRGRRSRPGTRPVHQAPRSGSGPAFGCAVTGSTRAARSPFVTARSCTTSAWATPTRASG